MSFALRVPWHSHLAGRRVVQSNEVISLQSGGGGEHNGQQRMPLTGERRRERRQRLSLAARNDFGWRGEALTRPSL